MSTPTATAASSRPTASLPAPTAAPGACRSMWPWSKANSRTTERRSVVFRLGSTGLTLSHAAAGYLDGFVTLAGRRHAARRVDGDGNGRFTDPQDRLWIDLDDNGQWDPVDEQFNYSSVLAVAAAASLSAPTSTAGALSLDVLEGTGRVSLAFARPAATVLDLSATLVGRDGSAVGLSGSDAVTVPAGEYRLSTVTLTLADPAGGPTWSYVFSDNGRRGDASGTRSRRTARSPSTRSVGSRWR